MSLGSFGGAAPTLERVSSGIGGSPIPDALEEARERLGPDPEGQPAIREQVQAAAVSGTAAAGSGVSTTTTSVSLVDMDSMSVTLTTVASTTGVLIVVSLTVSGNTAGKTITLNLDKDGANIDNLTQAVTVVTADYRVPISLTAFDAAPTAGSHTYKLRWSIEAGGGTATAYHRRIDAQELRR